MEDSGKRAPADRPPLNDSSVCPVCGHMTVEINCKVVCGNCGHIIENCSGD